jgi:drug/metabolite transporter (DMT)-like permease
VLVFILQSSGARLSPPDAALIGAVLAAACGYAKGGQLAARLGSWQVICWSLVIALPVTATASILFVGFPQQAVAAPAWIGFAYVTLVSQLSGFFAWYHGLALGGIARVSQTQLFQLFFTLAASAWLLGEAIDGRILVYGTALVIAVATGARARIVRKAVSGAAT